MTLNISIPSRHSELKPRIIVFGVGGAGGNAVNNMIEKELEGVEFFVANTDAQALAQSRTGNQIQLGLKVTQGLGAGAKPDVGAAAAEESLEQIVECLGEANLCFVTAGLGGGTGTGAAPIIAKAAREQGVLTVGVVTKPFQFEGSPRMRNAEMGIEALQEVVDTLIIIPNQNLFRMANETTTITEAFSMADDVLYQGVLGVTDLMVRPGIINLDFADVRAVMDEMGRAMMGTGEAEGADRAVQAAEKAIANPLLDEISLHGARGVLINITGGEDLQLFEVDEAANRIKQDVDANANIFVGATLDPEMQGRMRVSVVATGIGVTAEQQTVARVGREQVETVEESPVGTPVETVGSSEPETETETNLLSGLEGNGETIETAAVVSEVEPSCPEGEAPHELGQPIPEKQPFPSFPTVEPISDRLGKAVPEHPIGLGPGAFTSAGMSEGNQGSAPRKGKQGIGSWIGRVTGISGDEQRRDSSERSPASANRGDGFEVDHQERIQIPAFLRRQAN